MKSDLPSPDESKPNCPVKPLWKPGEIQLSLSTIMAAGTWLWDIYAQANGIPYICPDWVRGLILAPYGGRVYSFLRDHLSSKKKD